MPRLTRVLSSGAVVAALTAGLTAGGLAATSAPALAAAPVSTTYTCATGLPIPGLSTFDVPATFTIPGLPAELPLGVPTPELPVTGTLSIDSVVLNLLGLVSGTLQGVTATVLAPLGVGQVGVQLQTAVTAVGASGLVTTVSGVLPSFTPDEASTGSIPLPTTIDLSLLSLGLKILGASCSLKGTGGGATTFPQFVITRIGAPAAAKVASSTSPRVAKVKKGAKPKVTVKVAVATAGAVSSGTVSATEGTRSYGSQQVSGGVATFVFKRLKKGKHTIRFVYSGSAAANGSEQSVGFRFPKATKAPAHTTKHQHR